MDLRKTLTLASDTLSKQGIDHALIGGFALAVHGVHRATQDIDFLADGAEREKILASLEQAGFQLRHGSSEVLHFGGVGTLDILLANRPLSLQMIRDAVSDSNLKVRVLKAEDIIGLKIQAYVNDRSREFQDKADIQNLIKANPALDWARIQKYADLFGEWPTIEAIRKTT